MSFARILGSQPKGTSKELVVDVLSITPDGTTPTIAGRNAASISRNGAGDYTVTLRGVGRELLGVTTGVEDAEGMICNWNTYSSSAKTFNVLITDDAGTASDAPDSVTVVLFWNNSGVTENS